MGSIEALGFARGEFLLEDSCLIRHWPEVVEVTQFEDYPILGHRGLSLNQERCLAPAAFIVNRGPHICYALVWFDAQTHEPAGPRISLHDKFGITKLSP